MEGTERVYALLNERGGYPRTREARKNGVENKTLQRMVIVLTWERPVFNVF